MAIQNYRKQVKYLPAVFIMSAWLVSFCFAQENAVSNETAGNEMVSVQNGSALDITKVASKIKEAIAPTIFETKKLEERESNTQEVIRKKEGELEQDKTEAQKAFDEKIFLEKELFLKQELAVSVRRDLDLVKEEAAKARTPQLVKKIKELTTQANKLDSEAAGLKGRLGKVASKAEQTQKGFDTNLSKLQQLRDSLESLQKEKAAKRSWVEKGVMAAVLIFIGLILFVLIKLGVRKFEDMVTEKGKIRESEIVLRVKTLSHLFYWLGTLAIFAIISYMILQTFGFDVAPLLAGIGIVGIAFGFGGQYLIRDVINGFFILLEGQYRINDVVKIGDFGGLVENINLRITTLRDLEGRVIIIPNGEIKTVVNFTKEYSYALFDIGVAYKENVDRVMQVIKDMGKELRKDPYFGKLILDDLEMFGVDDFGDSQVTIKFRIKTLPIKQWEVAREFRRRLKNRFDELGIEIPFPHRTLYLGAGSDNDWFRKMAQKFSSEK